MISVDVDSDSMKPRGVPITVMVLRKMKETDERMEKLEFLLAQIIQDQEKLSELIPLSAAGSGMMIGTQQLHNLLHDISDVIRQELSNKENHTIPTSDSGNSVFQAQRILKTWTWGGRLANLVPQSFRLDRNQIDVRRLWWMVDLETDNGWIHPLKEIIIKRKLILDAYKFRNEDPQ
jgi:hypothetical protein